MESLMSGAILIEAGLLSFLLAMWITWLGLSGLFRLLPATSRTSGLEWFVASRQADRKSRRAA